MSVFRTTVKSLVVSAAAFLLGTAAVAHPANIGEVLPQAHKSLDCASCHGTDTTNIPSNDACLKCHGPMEKLIASTGKYALNPHNSPHWGESVPCGTCHKQHSQPKVYCEACHTNQNYRAR